MNASKLNCVLKQVACEEFFRVDQIFNSILSWCVSDMIKERPYRQSKDQIINMCKCDHEFLLDTIPILINTYDVSMTVKLTVKSRNYSIVQKRVRFSSFSFLLRFMCTFEQNAFTNRPFV